MDAVCAGPVYKSPELSRQRAIRLRDVRSSGL